MPYTLSSPFVRSFVVATLVLMGATGYASAQTADSATLTRIASTGLVRVGYIPTPGTFAFQDPQGQTLGYSIDLCLRVIENVRKHLKRPDLKVSYTPLKGAQRIPLLKGGEIDIECGGNTNTVARQQEVDFSHTFFTTGARLLTKKSFKVEKNADLWKRRVAVSKGTTAETLVNRLKVEQNLEVFTVATDPEGVTLVELGKVDAFAQDDILLYGLIGQSSNGEQLMVTGRFMSVEPYAFMLPKGDAGFREIVDKTMLALMSSGELLTIYKKWFDTDRLRVPMNVYMKENIKFPNRYGIP
ncbi:MAG: amino acid ABC transporter substrate-binding protein [Pseudomonadota bacterium]